jgi:ATP-dependent DNA helicase PIF1
MTINKAQGQTLDFVGLYLPEPVFSHGQLYVALSRAKSSKCIKVLMKPNGDGQRHYSCTKNVVYKEVLAAVSST